MAVVAGEAGKFKVYADGTFEGPKEYVEQVDVNKIMNSFKILAQAAPIGCSTYQLLAVTLQTDYAGWLGMKEMEGWGKK